MGLITFLGVAGALYIIIGTENLAAVLPEHSYDDLLQLTTGIHGTIFQHLTPEQQVQVVDQVTFATRNPFGLVMAASALTFTLSLFLGVSLLLLMMMMMGFGVLLGVVNFTDILAAAQEALLSHALAVGGGIIPGWGRKYQWRQLVL